MINNQSIANKIQENQGVCWQIFKKVNLASSVLVLGGEPGVITPGGVELASGVLC